MSVPKHAIIGRSTHSLTIERRRKLFKEYDVYHDESQLAGFWHGILLVPRSTRRVLLDLLSSVRQNTAQVTPISLKNVARPHGRKFRCTRAWLQIGIAALIQRLKGERYPVFTAEDARYLGYGLLDKAIGARLVIFRLVHGHEALHRYVDYGAKVETTFRIGLKGGLGIFSGESDEICVRSFHFDGHEHYGRRIDLHRILARIGRLPAHVRLPASIALDDRTSDHRSRDSQPTDDCQLLQLTDLLVSGFRTVLAEPTNDAQRVLCAPLRELSDRWRQGAARMRNSRWHKGFCISEAYLEAGQWRFGSIEPAGTHNQPTLFEVRDRVGP